MCQTSALKFGHSQLATRKMCEKIDCDTVENEFVIYSANPAFYAFCSVSCGVKQTFMYKCENEETHIFNKESRNCIYDCKSSGYFADSSDCSTYYICNGKRSFTVQQVKCPPEFYFNGTACVNSTKHCALGSIISTPIESSTSSQTQTTSENVSNPITTQISPFSEQSSAESTTTSETSISSFNASYPSISFLPCPLWLKVSNNQICSQIGSYVNYGEQRRNKDD